MKEEEVRRGRARSALVDMTILNCLNFYQWQRGQNFRQARVCVDKSICCSLLHSREDVNMHAYMSMELLVCMISSMCLFQSGKPAIMSEGCQQDCG